MGITVSEARYSINGTLLTENPVFDNLEKLCNSCGCWLTYDTHQGKWAVIINRAGDSVQSFDDNNIIGAINLSTTGLDSYYNIMKATYVHEDLKGQTDFIQIEVPLGDQYPNETINTLDLTYDLVTDPVQAQLLGFIELKQARADKVVSFRTDYTKIALKAGDIIDITNSVYSWVNQKFRIITVREVDTDEGDIEISIIALEYDPSVYDESNLNRYIRSDENGIIDGSILPPPDTPVVDKIEDDARPRVIISTSLTGGLVNEVEFYVTNDVPPDFPEEEGRSYRYLTTATTSGEDEVFPLNESITVEVDTLNSGNFLVKCRAKNSEAVSDWSEPAGFIWEPTFTIDPNVTIGTDQIDGLDDLFANCSISLTANAIAHGLTIARTGDCNWLIGYQDSQTDMYPLNPITSVTDPEWLFVNMSWDPRAGVKDVDFRARVVPETFRGMTSANIGQINHYDAVGTMTDTMKAIPSANTSILTWPYVSTSNTMIVTYGGDQKCDISAPIYQEGKEQFVVDLYNYKTLYPNATSMILEVRVNNFTANAVSTQITAGAQFYQGGTPVIELPGNPYYQKFFKITAGPGETVLSSTTFNSTHVAANPMYIPWNFSSNISSYGNDQLTLEEFELYGYFVYDIVNNKAGWTGNLSV